MCIRDSSGGYRQGARSPFQGGDALFENVCRGVHQAVVDVARLRQGETGGRDVYKRQHGNNAADINVGGGGNLILDRDGYAARNVKPVCSPSARSTAS